MKHKNLARCVSILGHPAVLSPLVMISVLAHESSSLLFSATVSTTLVVLVVMIYSWWKVRTGRWQHVDASIPNERRALNPTLAIICIGAAFTLMQLSNAKTLGVGFLFSSIIPITAMLFSRWHKLSLHVAFASYLATWLWAVTPVFSGIGLAVALAIAWSRIELQRHTLVDVCSGLLVGLCVGGLFLTVLKIGIL
jgi:membrane-associated phospholipid phosphatase